MDTSCTHYRTELSAFLDGQLDVKDQSDVQGHLNNCENCSDELETLKKLTKFLNDQMHPDNVAMPEIWNGIQAQMPDICDVMEEDLSAYLDGELTPAAQEGVNKHLKECAVCLDSFGKLNAANRLLTKGLELPLSIKVDLWPAVKAQLNEDCAVIRSELSPFADQEVVNLRHRNITNHLTDCQECRSEFNRLSAVGDIIRDSYRPDIPDDFDLWPGIRQKMQIVPFVAKASAKPKPTRLRMVVGGAIAAAVIGATGIVASLVIPHSQDSNTISSEAYLIESALMEPSDVAEAAVYEQ
jgi:anti-sigma factor RsiW